MKLYINPMSANAQHPIKLVEHLGLECEMVVVDLQAGEQRRPEFLALNPMGRVPVLVDEDTVIWESHAILFYLASKHAPELLGSGLVSQTRVQQWLSWNLAHLSPHMSALGFERRLKGMFGMGEPDQERIAREEKGLAKCLAILEDLLSEKDWVAGERSIADFSLASSVGHKLAGHNLDGYPAILRWMDRQKG